MKCSFRIWFVLEPFSFCCPKVSVTRILKTFQHYLLTQRIPSLDYVVCRLQTGNIPYHTRGLLERARGEEAPYWWSNRGPVDRLIVCSHSNALTQKWVEPNQADACWFEMPSQDMNSWYFAKRETLKLSISMSFWMLKSAFRKIMFWGLPKLKYHLWSNLWEPLDLRWKSDIVVRVNPRDRVLDPEAKLQHKKWIFEAAVAF